MAQVEIKPKVQTITYEHQDGSLGKEYATSDKRISLAEAESILLDRNIIFKEVLKVKYEYITLSLSTDQINEHLQD